MTEVICPYCEQDIIWQISLDYSYGAVYCMCFEYDTIWMPKESMIYGTGVNFELFMEQQGKMPDWSIIIRMKQLDIVQ